VHKDFSDYHQHHLKWCKVLGVIEGQVGKTFNRCIIECWWRVYMSINHGKTIDEFKEHGGVVVRKRLHKHNDSTQAS
jgi:hypothetical protein